MAKYGDEFKHSVVHELRATKDSISAVARRHGIAPSTLVRWDAQFADAGPPAAVPTPTGTLVDPELADVLDRLGRKPGDVTWVRRIAGHNRRVAWWDRATDALAVVLGLSVLGALGVGYLVLHATSTSPARAYVGWTVFVLLAAWLISAVLDVLFAWLSGWFRGGFVRATLHLFRAEQILASDDAGALHDPRGWHLRARRRRRRLRASLRKAEAVLTRRTTLGRTFRTTGAKEWELAQRRNIARTIGYVETILELEGVLAYERSRQLLRQVAWLTLLRDWSLDDLPVLPDAPTRYQSPLRRLATRLWMPIPLIGLLASLILAIQSLWPFIQRLR